MISEASTKGEGSAAGTCIVAVPVVLEHGEMATRGNNVGFTVSEKEDGSVLASNWKVERREIKKW